MSENIPAGWKLVPIEPTDAMVDAGRVARMNVAGGYEGPSGWQAMLDAAPPPYTHISLGWRPVSCLKLRMMAGKLRKANPSDETAALLEEAAADIERLAHASAELSVAVKPLVWDGARKARALGATWMVWPYSDPLKDGLGNWLWQCVDAVPHASGCFHTEAEAKAAAQADYESRIRTALSPTADTQNPLSSTNGEIGETRQAPAELSELQTATDGYRAPAPAELSVPFQDRVKPWMMACFGAEISADRLERNDRFIEEALELVQASDYPKERAIALVDYVYGRDQGEINQEVGGVMVTLAAHCLAHGLDMHEAAETELARIWTKVEQIRAKQAAKPTGSALPIAASPMEGGE
jgi:NTP pyrophosphatase (non-canonical NTP hydrolase)